MIEYCDHCHTPLGVSVVYDHGRRYHPLCYEPAVEARLRAEEQKLPHKDWSEGLYES